MDFGDVVDVSGKFTSLLEADKNWDNKICCCCDVKPILSVENGTVGKRKAFESSSKLSWTNSSLEIDLESNGSSPSSSETSSSSIARFELKFFISI